MTHQPFEQNQPLGVGNNRPEEHMRFERQWTLDKHIPVAMLIALFLQTAGAVWWAASITGRVGALEQQNTTLVPLTAAVAKVEATVSDMRDDMKDIKSTLRSIPVPTITR